MPTDQPNPYAAPESAPQVQNGFDSASQAKIEAIIKDAGQFWLAILMCIFCTGFGAIIIGPWYLVRLIQWHSLAQSEPKLLDPDVPRGSLEQKFQAAKIKLIIGISFGGIILLLVVLFFIASLTLA